MSVRAVVQNAYDLSKSYCADLKTLCIDVKNSSAAGPISANVIKQLLERLVKVKEQITAISAISGISTYAQAQENDVNYNVLTEWATMITEIDNTITWVLGWVPTGTGGFALIETWSSSGFNVRTATTAQTAGLRTQLDLLIATIN